MSNKRKRNKARRIIAAAADLPPLVGWRPQATGFPGGNFAADRKGRFHRVLSPGGLAPGARVGPPIQPGLDGSYHGTCTGCLQPTDTGLAIAGPAEAHIAFLIVLGLTPDEAIATAQEAWREKGWEGSGDEVPDGDRTDGYRVCAACAPPGMEVREVHGELNVYRPPGDGES